jgi:ABC-2 type transport system permease protein
VIRLLGSEVRRLLHRRTLLWLTFVMLGLVVTIVVINVAQSDTTTLNPSDAMRTTDLWLTQAAARRLGVDAVNRVATISVLCYIMVVVLGATAIGAEYRAGTVTTVLTWEPRRVRLLVARLLAAAFVSMMLFVVVHVVFVGGWALGAQASGVTTGTGGDFWRDLIVALLRGTLLAGMLAVLSGSFATLGRNTGAALGIWFGYLVAVEAILSPQVKATTPWILTLNAAAFYGWEPTSLNGHTVSGGAGTVRIVLYVLVVGAAALVTFTRRDVT